MTHECRGISNGQQFNYSFNSLSVLKTRETPMSTFLALCEGNPSQWVSNVDSIYTVIFLDGNNWFIISYHACKTFNSSLVNESCNGFMPVFRHMDVFSLIGWIKMYFLFLICQYLYPAQRSWRGVYWIHLVRPSVRLSVDDMVSGA